MAVKRLPKPLKTLLMGRPSGRSPYVGSKVSRSERELFVSCAGGEGVDSFRRLVLATEAPEEDAALRRLVGRDVGPEVGPEERNREGMLGTCATFINVRSGADCDRFGVECRAGIGGGLARYGASTLALIHCWLSRCMIPGRSSRNICRSCPSISR